MAGYNPNDQKAFIDRILFICSRYRDKSKNNSEIISSSAVSGLSKYLDRLLEIKEMHEIRSITLYGVDVKFLKYNIVHTRDHTIKDWDEFEESMKWGWRYHLEEVLNSAIDFANKNEIPESMKRDPTRLLNLMELFRYRVSADAQARCLDAMLSHPLTTYQRAGAFIKHGFNLLHHGYFDHDLIKGKTTETYPHNKYPRIRCCEFSETENVLGSPIYCKSCGKFVCSACNKTRCVPKLLSYIKSTFYIRVRKAKSRPHRKSRPMYEAVGEIFPRQGFETMEDCFLNRVMNIV